MTRPYIARSEDFGETWSAPIPVNTDTTTAFHWWPTVAVDDNGYVNVFYLGHRLNPDTGRTGLFLSQSVDESHTCTDVRISDVFSSWQGMRTDPGLTYASDYLRAVSDGSVL